MSTNNNSFLERVQSSYSRLTEVASKLNQASDELGNAIASLDESLKQLNLGIVAWHCFAESDDEHGNYVRKHIGYAKLGTKWGISISRGSGNYNHGEPERAEEWPFNDAPRQLRMEAVEHIPAMIDAMIARADEAAQTIRNKTNEAQALADALKPKPSSFQGLQSPTAVNALTVGLGRYKPAGRK